MSHANARLTVQGRLLLVQRVIRDRRPVAHVAKELGVSRQCAHRWVSRFRAEGEPGMLDRSSRPRRTPTKTPAQLERRVLAARRSLRMGRDTIAAATGVPARTVTGSWPATACRPLLPATRSPACRSAPAAPPRTGTSGPQQVTWST